MLQAVSKRTETSKRTIDYFSTNKKKQCNLGRNIIINKQYNNKRLPGFIINSHYLNNLRYEDDNMLMPDSKEKPQKLIEKARTKN